MIVDTSALLAYFDRSEPDHERCATAIEAATDELVVSPYVVAEFDYLVATRVGVDAALTALAELAGGAWELPAFDRTDLDTARGVVASNVVLAARFHTRTIATLDHRHFDVLRPLDGGRFRVVP